jgi:hypothetical protein
MTRDELIEKMARAICQHKGEDPDASSASNEYFSYGDAATWHVHVPVAAAALTAIETAGMDYNAGLEAAAKGG